MREEYGYGENSNRCYRITTRAYIFQILGLEIFYVPVEGDIDAELIETFKKFREERILMSWTTYVVIH
jgi:hypothetical protein